MDGGIIIAKFLLKQNVKFLFTLCGGHISPILAACKANGIRVIDVRHEATAVFAADAVSRISGVPGVAAVTAGPGLTNTITAVRNAYMAQSPLILLGGSTATILKGRGSLQDIDQMELIKPNVKWSKSVKYIKEIIPALEEAFYQAQNGVPGPVFLELPVDLLYSEEIVRQWYFAGSGKKKSIADRGLNIYLEYHLKKQFSGREELSFISSHQVLNNANYSAKMSKVINLLNSSEKPVLMIGSQAMSNPQSVDKLISAVEKLGVPVYLSGMARGLMGERHELQLKHKRKEALKKADTVILAGVPCDFRLDYGKHINKKANLISINKSEEDLYKNRKPKLAIQTDPGDFIKDLAFNFNGKKFWQEWLFELKNNDRKRDDQIFDLAKNETNAINPVFFMKKLNLAASPNSTIIVDGGDFAATAAYTFFPRGPYGWLDPGVFGTLGVGAGFALGAKLCRPDSEVWVIFGDGSFGYSLIEFDTFVRHKIPVIAVIGNDACWSQIAREQTEILKDDVATVLNYTDYHIAVRGLGAEGFRIENQENIDSAIRDCQLLAQSGKPVVLNTIIGKTEFRKGSISI